jgi:hypothetical protein
MCIALTNKVEGWPAPPPSPTAAGGLVPMAGPPPYGLETAWELQ